MGKLPIDWSQVGPIMEARILDEIERRLIPDIRSRIKVKFSYAPPDFAHDLNAHMGSAFSLEPLLTQSAWFPRAQSRRRDLQPLLRRRRHASGRRHSRRCRLGAGPRPR